MSFSFLKNRFRSALLLVIILLLGIGGVSLLGNRPPQSYTPPTQEQLEMQYHGHDIPCADVRKLTQKVPKREPRAYIKSFDELSFREVVVGDGDHILLMQVKGDGTIRYLRNGGYYKVSSQIRDDDAGWAAGKLSPSQLSELLAGMNENNFPAIEQQLSFASGLRLKHFRYRSLSVTVGGSANMIDTTDEGDCSALPQEYKRFEATVLKIVDEWLAAQNPPL